MFMANSVIKKWLYELFTVRQVRRKSNLPLILDEYVNNMADIVRAYNDKACDVIALKPSKLGGLSQFRQVRCCIIYYYLQI